MIPRLIFTSLVTLVFTSGSNSASAFRTPVTANPPMSAWTGSSGDFTVGILLIPVGDSVFARGTYKVASAKRVGCGGESLFDHGSFTMRARGNMQSFQGKFFFDAGWEPPFSANRTGPKTLKVSIRSVDRGPCVLVLRPKPKAH